MKTTGEGSGTPKGGAAGAGQYSPYGYAPYAVAHHYHHGQHQQRQQAYSPYSYSGGRRGGGVVLRDAPKRSPLQAAAQDDTDGASRVQLMMQHQQQVMAMQSEHVRKMHEADRATAAAVTAVLNPAAAAAKKCTPLGANGRPLQLQDGASQKEGMAPGSLGGPSSGRRRGPKPKSRESYTRSQEEPQTQAEDDPEIMPPLQPHQPPAQPYQHPPHPTYHNQQHPYPYPYPPYSPYSPAVSPHYTHSPSHFTFDTAHVEASRTATAAHTAHAGAGAVATGTSATPVAVTPGGAVAAVAPAGAPITPGGAPTAATSIRSTSGLSMTCVEGQLRLSDGTLMLASEEDGTTNYLKDVSGQTIDMVMLLLPDHIRLVRESVEVFCATEAEDIEVVEDTVVSDGQEKGGQEKANEKKTIRTTAIGQMGLRCVHCRHLGGQHVASGAAADDRPEIAPNAAFYPTNLEDIHECVVLMAEHHFAACPHFPPKMRLRQLLAQEKQKSANAQEDEQRKTAVKAFFMSAAEKMGLSNNPEGWGIRYGSSSLSTSNNVTPKEVDPKASSTEEETAAEVADALAIAYAFGADVDAIADEDNGGADKEKGTSKEKASSKAPGSPPPRPRPMRREIRSRQSISSHGALGGHAVLGNGACKPLLTPNAGDHYQGNDMEALQLAQPPPYDSILNFPQGKRKQYGSDNRLCVMCGLFFPTAVRTYPLDDAQKKKSNNLRSARKGGATTIPPQNKGVCTVCDVVVWKQVSTGHQLKFCKGKYYAA